MSLDGKGLENGESRMPEVITFVHSELESDATTKFPGQSIGVKVTILPYVNKEGVAQSVDLHADKVSGFLSYTTDFYKGTSIVARELGKVTIFGDFNNGLRCAKVNSRFEEIDPKKSTDVVDATNQQAMGALEV